jgi:hypothetical protein
VRTVCSVSSRGARRIASASSNVCRCRFRDSQACRINGGEYASLAQSSVAQNTGFELTWPNGRGRSTSSPRILTAAARLTMDACDNRNRPGWGACSQQPL